MRFFWGFAKRADEMDMSGPAPSKEEVISFIRSNPNPSDDDVHDFSEENGYNNHKTEKKIYELATTQVKGRTMRKEAFFRNFEKRAKWDNADTALAVGGTGALGGGLYASTGDKKKLERIEKAKGRARLPAQGSNNRLSHAESALTAHKAVTHPIGDLDTLERRYAKEKARNSKVLKTYDSRIKKLDAMKNKVKLRGRVGRGAAIAGGLALGGLGIKKLLEKKAKEMVRGGIADDKPASKYPADQIKKGIEIEFEHTNDRDLAREIAKDHLEENKKYYTHLEKMEKEMDKKAESVEDLFVRKNKLGRYYNDASGDGHILAEAETIRE